MWRFFRPISANINDSWKWLENTEHVRHRTERECRGCTKCLRLFRTHNTECCPLPQCQLLVPPPRPSVPSLSRIRSVRYCPPCSHPRRHHQQLHSFLVPTMSSKHDRCSAVSLSAACDPSHPQPSLSSHAPVHPTLQDAPTSAPRPNDICIMSLCPRSAASMIYR